MRQDVHEHQGEQRGMGMSLGGWGTTRTIVDWGGAPIQMRRVRPQLSLRTDANKARLSVLSLAGAPNGTADAEIVGGNVRFNLDTGAVVANPTTYFLLELE